MPEGHDPLVLVVDDDAELHVLMRAVLQRSGFRVDHATDGAEAIEKISNHDYATILLDLLMPRIDGFDVLWHLHTVRPFVLHRVIVLTAVSRVALEKIDAASVFAVLRKPFDLTQMISAVASCSRETSVSRSPPVFA